MRPGPGYEGEYHVGLGQVERLHDVPISHRFLQTLVGEAVADAPADAEGSEY
jgi:hypothetical protein